MMKLLPLIILLGGCTTAPVPNILIETDGNVSVTVFTDIDKATLGDDSAIHDEDSGLKDPKLGL